MLKEIDIRQIQTISELEKIQYVEKAVWNTDTVPVHQTFTTVNNGGIILGAYYNESMVGFLYSFPGFDGNKHYLCSHMLGILPEFRKYGIGLAMKFKQAELAKKIGYSMITWTFDPLQSINAFLNLQKLGSVGAFYKENYYGDMNDKLNAGLPTDRMHIHWDLHTENKHRYLPFNPKKVLLDVKDDAPNLTDVKDTVITRNKGPWFVAIPNDFNTIKEENSQLALQWRLQTRIVFQKLFRAGYQAYGLHRDKQNQLNYYLFM